MITECDATPTLAYRRLGPFSACTPRLSATAPMSPLSVQLMEPRSAPIMEPFGDQVMEPFGDHLMEPGQR